MCWNMKQVYSDDIDSYRFSSGTSLVRIINTFTNTCENVWTWLKYY